MSTNHMHGKQFRHNRYGDGGKLGNISVGKLKELMMIENAGNTTYLKSFHVWTNIKHKTIAMLVIFPGRIGS